MGCRYERPHSFFGCTGPVTWTSLTDSVVQLANVVVHFLKPTLSRPPRPTPATPGGGAVPPVPLGDAAAGEADRPDPRDEAEVEAQSLEAMLEAAMDAPSSDEDHPELPAGAADFVAAPISIPVDEDGVGPLFDSDDDDTEKAPVPTAVVTALQEGSVAVKTDVVAVVMAAKDALADAKSRAEEGQSADLIRNGDVSLIVHGEGVKWMHWPDVAASECRHISLGPAGNLKAYVPFKVPRESVLGSRIVIARCPAVYLRRKAAHGPDIMPPWCRLLYTWESSLFFSGPLDESPGIRCIVCESGARHGLLATESMTYGHDLFRCVTCTCVWHLRCCYAFLPGLLAEDLNLQYFNCPVCV